MWIWQEYFKYGCIISTVWFGKVWLNIYRWNLKYYFKTIWIVKITVFWILPLLGKDTEGISCEKLILIFCFSANLAKKKKLLKLIEYISNLLFEDLACSVVLSISSGLSSEVKLQGFVINLTWVYYKA